VGRWVFSNLLWCLYMLLRYLFCFVLTCRTVNAIVTNICNPVYIFNLGVKGLINKPYTDRNNHFLNLKLL
jgi:hypothetical protein